MKRSNHTAKGLVFVAACLLIGALIYQGIFRSSTSATDGGASLIMNNMSVSLPGNTSIDTPVIAEDAMAATSDEAPATDNDDEALGEQSEDGVTETIRAGERFDQNERSMVARYWDLNATCRGGSGDEQSTEDACEKREVLFHEMEQAGLCWGSVGDESQADYRWHHCDGQSLQRQTEHGTY